MKHIQKLICKFAFALAIIAGMNSAAMAEKFVAGTDYRVIENPEVIETNRVIVREFFWYGCSHCNNLEPYVQEWLKTKAKDVVFMKTPAAFNRNWEVSARAFYAAQKLGVAKKSNAALFDAIHKEGKNMFTQSALADFYAGFGADKKEFNRLYNSFAVGTKVNKAKRAAMALQLTGVPAFVVHGKYVVPGTPQTFDVVNFLVEKVRKDGLAIK